MCQLNGDVNTLLHGAVPARDAARLQPQVGRWTRRDALAGDSYVEMWVCRDMLVIVYA